MKTRPALLHRIAITLLSIAAAGQAVAISVTTTNDGGAGSLRQAIADASSGDTITFSLPAGSVISLTSGTLSINKNLTINGPGANQLTITRADSESGIFVIFRIAGGNVTLSGVTITNGSSKTCGTGTGGGIVITGGTLTLANSTISGNTAGDQWRGNLQQWQHGEHHQQHNLGQLRRVQGGGIYSDSSSTVNIINSTISGNSAVYYGGGILNDGSLTVTNSTIAGNFCPMGPARARPAAACSTPTGPQRTSAIPRFQATAGPALRLRGAAFTIEAPCT